MTIRTGGILTQLVNSDGLDPSTQTSTVASIEFGYNGATWDRVRTGATSGLAFGAIRNAETQSPALQSDEAADDSDKTLTVPADTAWKILWVWVELNTSATAGNRQLRVDFRDASDDIMLHVQAGMTQPASSGRAYLFAPCVPASIALVATQLYIPYPPDVWLTAGQDVRVLDGATIAPAADDMVVQMMVDERSIP